MKDINKNRKGYKETPLGWIPDDWEVKELRECFKLKSGDVKPKDISLENVNNYKFPVYGGNGIMGYSKKYNLEGGRIIIGRVGEYCGITRMINGKYWITDNALYSDSIKRDFNLNFLKYKLQYEDLSKLRNRGGQPLISQQPIYSKKIFSPPLKEQEKIAQLLDKWDSAIETTEKLISAKEKLKKSLMKKLLTGKVRLKGFNGKWEGKKIEELLDYEQPTKYLVQSDKYNDIYSLPVLTANKAFVLGYTNETNGVYTNIPAIIFDDFTIDSKFVDFSFKVKSSAIKILKTKNDENNLKFIFEKMQLIKFLTGGHKRHYISEYQNIKIDIPILQEQNAIIGISETLDKEIQTLKSQLELYRRQKKGLMQVLLTGKVRVKI